MSRPAGPPGAAAPLIRLQDVGVRFGRVQALQGVGLEIAAGECVALIGGNGSGKSTLLRVIHGLIAPTEGQLVVPARRAQAMLFQRPWMMRTTVLRNVALGLWLRGLPWRQAQERALRALERVQLAELASRRAPGLSGGQQQRVALARAWAQQAQLLLLDEPTASLDPHARLEVEALMRAFTGSAPDAAPLTMVFASHHLGQVRRLAQRVICLDQGRVLADLPVAQFFDHARLSSVAPVAAAFVQGEM